MSWSNDSITQNSKLKTQNLGVFSAKYTRNSQAYPLGQEYDADHARDGDGLGVEDAACPAQCARHPAVRRPAARRDGRTDDARFRRTHGYLARGAPEYSLGWSDRRDSGQRPDRRD